MPYIKKVFKYSLYFSLGLFVFVIIVSLFSSKNKEEKQEVKLSKAEMISEIKSVYNKAHSDIDKIDLTTLNGVGRLVSIHENNTDVINEIAYRCTDTLARDSMIENHKKVLNMCKTLYKFKYDKEYTK